MEFLETKFIFMIHSIYLMYLPAKVSGKAEKCTQKGGFDGIFPKRQAYTPKEKCHQRAVAPAAPQPLTQSLCCFWIPHLLTPFYNA